MGYFCRKYVMFELKEIHRSCDLKNDLWFQKWHKKFGKFSHKKLKIMFDESSVYNVLAEGLYFLDKSKPIKFQLFGLSTAFLKLFKVLMCVLKPGVSFV